MRAGGVAGCTRRRPTAGAERGRPSRGQERRRPSAGIRRSWRHAGRGRTRPARSARRRARPPAPARASRRRARPRWVVARGRWRRPVFALGLALAPLGPGAALGVGALAGGGLMALRARALAGLALLLVVGGALVGEWRLAALDSHSERIEDGREPAARRPPRFPPAPLRVREHRRRSRSRTGPLDGARLLLRLPRWVEAPRVGIGAELGAGGPAALARAPRARPGLVRLGGPSSPARRGGRVPGRPGAADRRGGVAASGRPARSDARGRRARGRRRDERAATAPWREAWCSARTRRSTRACARTSGTPDWLTCWPSAARTSCCSPPWPCRSSPRPGWVRADAASRCWCSSPSTCRSRARGHRSSARGSWVPRVSRR